MKHIKILSTALSLVALGGYSAQGESRPNVIVVLCDDMGYSDLGCYGSEIRTPNIDKLAEEGIRFTQFYANSRSCPSRASLLTGMYPTNAGVGQMSENYQIPEYQGYLRSDCVTIAEAMKHNGYQTYMSGKWHMGAGDGQWPADRGFDGSYVFLGGATDYYEPGGMAIDKERIVITDPNFYLTDAITDNALEYLKKSQQSNDPFFMYVAYTAPHWPLQASQEVIDKYREVYAAGWDKIREQRFEKMKKIGILPVDAQLSPRPGMVSSWDSMGAEQRDEWQLKMAVYAAVVDMMDAGVGRISEELKSLGIDENTVVIFLSDNGACPFPVNYKKSDAGSVAGGKGSAVSYDFPWANVSSTPHRYFKRWTYEGGINVPMVVRYPKLIKESRITAAVGHVIDILPTCLALSKGDLPTKYNGNDINPINGASLVGVFKGNDTPIHKNICWEHYGHRAIRKGDWKLVSGGDAKDISSDWELYNLAKDRSELHNVIGDYPSIAAELEGEYSLWMVENNVIPYMKLKDMPRKKPTAID